MSFTKVAPAGIGTEPGNSILIGDSLLHSTGIDIGSNTGIGVTIRKHGDATFTGIITASAFFGDGSGLEGVSSSGIGTPLSDDDTSQLNKVYYVNQELSIGSTVTVNHPDSAIASYTHYQDLVVKDNADFIVTDGDTFIPDVLGINTASLPNPVSGATGGRIRAGTITNAGANGAVNFPNGLTGTAGTFTGNLNVGGVLTYEDVTNVDSIGIVTARLGINLVGNDLNVGSNIKIGNASGIITATSYRGDGSALTGVGASFGNSSINSSGIITATSFTGSGANLTALPASNRNLIENGEFLVSQRFGDASSTKANSGTNIVNGVENGVIDRWRMGSPSASNFARQRVTDAPDGFAYSFKVTADGSGYSPASNANYSLFQQVIEATNVARLAFGTSSAKTVTLSFYVKSSYAATWAVALGSLTGDVWPGNATRTHIKSYTTNSANTWERKTITFPGDTSGTWPKTGTGGGMAVIWDLGSGGNHQGAATSTWVSSDDFRFSGAKNVGDSANGSWQITGIQLEIGSTATEYEHIPIQKEIERCQRYFYCSGLLGSGSWNSATVFHCAVHHPVAMRGRVTSGLTRSGVLTNINIEPRDQYDISVFDPDAHTHYSPGQVNSNQVMNFTISGSTTTGYSGTVCMDRNDDQFWLSAEL